MTGPTGQDNRATRTMEQTEKHLRASPIGEPQRLIGKIRLVDYHPAWPQQFASEAGKIRAALGAGALRVEHVGSTSVPGLAAKPLIDIVLVVADSANEASYVPALEAAGYVLRIREPEWFEHRMLRGADPDVNLHRLFLRQPRGRAHAHLPRLAARQRRRPRVIRAHQARAGATRLDLCAALCRRQDGGCRGHPGASGEHAAAALRRCGGAAVRAETYLWGNAARLRRD